MTRQSDENSGANADRNLWLVTGRVVWRFGLTAVTGATLIATLWIKANVPSREQFETLQSNTASKTQFETLSAQVQNVREEVIRRPDYRETLKDFEMRLRELERKFPASGPRRPGVPPKVNDE